MRLTFLLPLVALGLASVGVWSQPPHHPPGAAPAGVTSPGRLVGPAGRWDWPLSPRPTLVRGFDPPATTYAAGHRGVDLTGDPTAGVAGRGTGTPVLAVDAGTVTHVGVVAGRGTVTVLHRTGVRSTYEPVEATVRRGEAVARGTVLGRLAAAGSHCRPACLHLGALRGSRYLDPMLFLAGPRPVRLLPLAQAPDG